MVKIKKEWGAKMKLKNSTYPYIVSATIGILFSYLIYISADGNQRGLLGVEDGPYETVGALFFLFSSLFFFMTYFKNKNNFNFFFLKSTRNIFFLLLGILFLVIFLEEISWGQRIFNITTPESIREINMQGELNIHNLEIFHAVTRDGVQKTGWQNMLTLTRIFSIFWFSWCVLLPLVYKYNYQIKKLIDKIDLPIIPISIGIFFLITYVVGKIIYILIDNSFRLQEIKECNIAFLFFIVSIWFFNNYKTTNKKQVA